MLVPIAPLVFVLLACDLILVAKCGLERRCACGVSVSRRLRSLSQNAALCKAALDALQHSERRLDAKQLKKYCRSPSCNCGQKPKPKLTQHTDPMYFLNEAIAALTIPIEADTVAMQATTDGVTGTVAGTEHIAVITATAEFRALSSKNVTTTATTAASAAKAQLSAAPSAPLEIVTKPTNEGSTKAGRVNHPLDSDFYEKLPQRFSDTVVHLENLGSFVYDILLSYGSARAFSLGFIPAGIRYVSCFKFLAMDGSTDPIETSSDRGFLDLLTANGSLLVAWKNIVPEEGNGISANCTLAGSKLTNTRCLHDFLKQDIESLFKNSDNKTESPLNDPNGVLCDHLLDNIGNRCLQMMISDGKCVNETFRFLQVHCCESTKDAGFIVPDDQSKERFQSGVFPEPITIGNINVECNIGYGMWNDSPVRKIEVPQKISKPGEVVY